MKAQIKREDGREKGKMGCRLPETETERERQCGIKSRTKTETKGKRGRYREKERYKNTKKTDMQTDINTIAKERK